MPRKFLVTGGAGFIGSHIATGLVERGEEVVVLDNLLSGRRENLAHLGEDVTLFEGSILDRRALERALVGVEVVYHQAALASVPWSVDKPLDTNEVCVTGTVNVLDAARRAGVRRVVFAGSSSATVISLRFRSKRPICRLRCHLMQPRRSPAKPIARPSRRPTD